MNSVKMYIRNDIQRIIYRVVIEYFININAMCNRSFSPNIRIDPWHILWAANYDDLEKE